jgi:hypothetical protein
LRGAGRTANTHDTNHFVSGSVPIRFQGGLDDLEHLPVDDQLDDVEALGGKELTGFQPLRRSTKTVETLTQHRSFLTLV